MSFFECFEVNLVTYFVSNNISCFSLEIILTFLTLLFLTSHLPVLHGLNRHRSSWRDIRDG